MRGNAAAMRVRLHGINRVRRVLATGERRVYYYHRATGKRIDGAPGSAEFVASWQAAQKAIASTDRHTGTLNAWITAYKSNDAFTYLATDTRKDYVKQIAKIEHAFGDMPIEALKEPAVRAEFLAWRDRLAKSSPRQADYAMTLLGRILSFAMNQGWLAVNPAAKPGRKYSVDRSQMIWEPEHIAAFMAVASVEMQLAMIVALNTGQRQGDLLAASWTAFEGGRVNITQSKRGTVVNFIQTAELRRILDAAPRRAVQVLTTAAGLPWKVDHFRHEWRAATIASKLDGLRFNDIRGTTVTRLADAECTPGLIASVTGHSQRSVHAILDKYQARTRAQGDLAISKLERSLKKAAAKQLQNGHGKNRKGTA
jgi:integrase